MPSKKEYAEIKAGVEGLVGDAPAPPVMADIPDAPTPGMTTTLQEEEPSEPAAYPQQFSQQQSYAPQAPAPLDIDRIHEIIEATVNEKWEEFLGKIGDLTTWKERTNINILSIKQELVRTNERFTNLQNAILGRVKTYDAGIQDIHTEMKALERVFDRIVEPLVVNIKELSKITDDLKRIKK